MPDSSFASLPDPPYYAAIFSSRRTPDDNGYAETASLMVDLASRQPGFLGVESARGIDGFGITVSYWQNLEAIAAWKAQMAHRQAQEMGRAIWYDHYELRIALVERAYSK